MKHPPSQPRRLCPEHGADLVRTATKFGDRWGCPIGSCTVACWGGKTSTQADADTRAIRHRCHEVFDPLWKSGAGSPFNGEPGGKQARRARAYAALAAAVGVPVQRAHFGMFTLGQCRRALEWLATLNTDGRHPKAGLRPREVRELDRAERHESGGYS